MLRLADATPVASNAEFGAESANDIALGLRNKICIQLGRGRVKRLCNRFDVYAIFVHTRCKKLRGGGSFNCSPQWIQPSSCRYVP